MRKTLFLCLFGLLLIGCQQEIDSPQLSEEIRKVETVWAEGFDKDELNAPFEPETSLDPASAALVYEKVLSEVAQSISRLEDRYKTKRTLFAGYDVGVIPNSNSCPSWSERIEFFMDCQDGGSTRFFDNPNQFGYGYRGSWVADGNLYTSFCRVDGRLFEGVSGTQFAVLRLGAFSPPNTDAVIRFFDNEDSRNRNWTRGDIAPNRNDGNTTWYLTGFRSNTGMQPPDLGFGYGVIGRQFFLQQGWLFVDDENSRNANGMSVNGVNCGQCSLPYIVGGSNTSIYITKVRN